MRGADLVFPIFGVLTSQGATPDMPMEEGQLAICDHCAPQTCSVDENFHVPNRWAPGTANTLDWVPLSGNNQ